MKRILVVDDNDLLCRLTCDILRNEGYWATPATSASEALRAFEEREFDLMVTDFRMPGMTGVELAQAVRQRNPRVPIIVISVYEPVQCEHVTLWLPKEYLFPQLLENISQCLAEAEAETVRS